MKLRHAIGWWVLEHLPRWAVLLAVLALVAMLAGCGSPEPAERHQAPATTTTVRPLVADATETADRLGTVAP